MKVFVTQTDAGVLMEHSKKRYFDPSKVLDVTRQNFLRLILHLSFLCAVAYFCTPHVSQ